MALGLFAFGCASKVNPVAPPIWTATATPTTAVLSTATPSATMTATGTPTHTPTLTPANTLTATPTDTLAATSTLTATDTATNSSTVTDTPTPTNSATDTLTDTPTGTPTVTDSFTATDTPTDTPSNTPSDTPTGTPTDTASDTPTATSTVTDSNTPTSTPTVTFTPSDTPTRTATGTPTQTFTATSTPTPCPNQVGKLTVGASSGSIHGVVWWLKVPISSTVTVSHLHTRFVNLNGGDQAIMCIYSDNGGMPGSLLVYQGYQVVVAGINDFPITSTVLNAGTTYWLAVATLNTATISYDTGTSGGWNQATAGPPDPVTGGTPSGINMDLWADSCSAQ